jgi:hypothetical protein
MNWKGFKRIRLNLMGTLHRILPGITEGNNEDLSCIAKFSLLKSRGEQ